MTRILKIRLAILSLLLMSLLGAWWPEFEGGVFDTAAVGVLTGSPACDPGLLCVAYLDVGQGDATLITAPSGTQVLIDGGRDETVLAPLAAVMGFWDTSIDYVIATHPDADHIGGLVGVFDRYSIADVVRTENESDTSVWEALSNAIAAEGSAVTYARRGQQIALGDGAVLEILFPDRDMRDAESNTSSIVARLTYGDTSFLFTGDSPKSVEEYLVLTEGEHLKSDVLKVGHHGSRTSSSELFVDEVAPTHAVISVGKDNQYGHPHVEVTDLLFNKRIKTLSTAEEGTILLMSDSTAVTVN